MTDDVAVRPAQPENDAALARLDANAWPVELQVAPPTVEGRPFFGE